MSVAIDKKTFYRRLYTLTLPIALQSLMLAAVAAGDAVMLGSIAQNSMAAVSLATQVQFVQNMMIGAVTPPMGNCIFITCSISDAKFEKVVKKIWPFIIAHILSLLLVTFAEPISMWLPNLLK